MAARWVPPSSAATSSLRLPDDLLGIAAVILGEAARDDRAVRPGNVNDVAARIGAAGRGDAGGEQAAALAQRAGRAPRPTMSLPLTVRRPPSQSLRAPRRAEARNKVPRPVVAQAVSAARPPGPR